MGIPNTPANITHMLQALDSPSKELTKWEENFLADVSLQFHHRNFLSDRQVEILEKLYADKTN